MSKEENKIQDYQPPAYMFIGRFLSQDICNHLLRDIVKADWKDSTTFGGDASKRTSMVKWLDNKTTPGLLDIIRSRGFFAARVLGIGVWPDHLDAIQVSRYREGEEYNWHVDLDATRTFLSLDRKLSIVISLCPGGKLELETFGVMNLNVGDAIVFPSFLNHRRPPVLEGEDTKYSLAVWFPGPAWS